MASLTRPKEYQIDTTVTGIDDGLVTINEKQIAPNVKDLGFIMNRGATVDNVGLIWNEINNLFRLIVTPDVGDEQNVNVTVNSNAPLMTGTQYISTGNFTVDGDARSGVYMMRNEVPTAGLAWSELFIDGVASQLIVTPNSVWTYEILVTGKRIDAGQDAASFKITGSLARNTTADSVFLVGNPSYTIVGRTDQTWEVEVNKDIATGALIIRVRGALGKTIRWVARIVTLEVSF